MSWKKKTKYYHIDEEKRKLYLSDEANKILGDLNSVKRIVSETKTENTLKNDFEGAYNDFNNKLG